MALARRWVSLGGWCGPSLILSKLGMRPPEQQGPFDFARTTMDGLIHFSRNGFDDFFPPGVPNAVPDPVSIWLLFRGMHTCFTHFDMNADTTRTAFRTRISEWDRIVGTGAGTTRTQPVTFLRTVLAEDPGEELSLVPAFQRALQERNPTLDHRLVLVVHDQGVPTQRLTSINERAMVWTVAFDESGGTSLFDKTEAGYRSVLEHACVEGNWLSSAQDKAAPVAPQPFRFQRRSHLSCVEGVPAFRGTCQGVGSTACAATGVCNYCGSTDGHALRDRGRFDSGRPWSEEEDAQVQWMSALVGAGSVDRVAAVEQLAGELSRGANETQLRLASAMKDGVGATSS